MNASRVSELIEHIEKFGIERQDDIVIVIRNGSVYIECDERDRH